jgi:hypothetical protein
MKSSLVNIDLVSRGPIYEINIDVEIGQGKTVEWCRGGLIGRLIPMQKMAKKKLLNGTEGVQLGDRP